MDKLSGIEFPTVGKRVFPEDWKKEQESKSQEIINRDFDAFGAGIDRGGNIVIGSLANTVDLGDLLVAYDENGKRIEIPPTAGIQVPNNSSCTIVVRHKFQETESTNPLNLPNDGPVIWRDNSYEILARQGALVVGDVALRAISTNSSGVVTLGNDLRVYRGLKGNRIQNNEVSEEKQASAVKTGLVTDLHSDIITGINPDINNPLKFVKAINQVYLVLKNFMDTIFKQEKKYLGEMFWMDELRSPSSDFPAFCLASADQVINATGTGGMPDLVSYWLNKPLRYDPLGTNVIDLDAISYTISSNVLTVTFANTTPCQKMIDALVEDNLVHGSFTNWMTGTLQQAIGAVPANATLAISALSAGSRTISFTCAAANSSGSLSGVKVRFYKHRLPDITPGTTITNQVRHFAMQGRSFVAVMDSDSDWIGGLRRRDRFQGHFHNSLGGDYMSQDISVSRSYIQGGDVAGSPLGQSIIREAKTDGTNGSPRIGKTTDARGQSSFPYVFAKRVL
ncbi:hypothetical protein EHQ05_05555 [Leptospira yasudae]|uniref:Phage tail protein n=1 Tax=Leptospira yasudae TaxID=2202201 RepID=A0ABX9MAN9_9LEPT|nr:hypothetical protein [Leptospira yasudae]RHX82203.1 hypothetical protein DLM77_01725 [Leptospira yasudae]TGK30419.1 hypothetical protein EHQ05_05555 [Leptospira yasudae]TGM04201.1 hypothetical protein EHQ86_13180 [Leptospira yasudae]